jgi:predicted  nucleic acid-binding Zn-ribbon protein
VIFRRNRDEGQLKGKVTYERRIHSLEIHIQDLEKRFIETNSNVMTTHSELHGLSQAIGNRLDSFATELHLHKHDSYVEGEDSEDDD